MSMPAVSIFAVEDNPLHQANIELTLTDLGYQLSGMADKAETAFPQITRLKPDIVLLDINLAGKTDGIQLAEQINDWSPTPIIFITSHDEPEFFERASQTRPYAYLVKPIGTTRLQRSIEKAIQHFRLTHTPEAETATLGPEALFKDAFFLKIGTKLVKINIPDILWCESAGNRYSAIVTKERKANLRISLVDLQQKLAPHPFLRVHRSYLVNPQHIASINEADQTIGVGAGEIPLGASYKEAFYAFLRRL